MRKLVVSTIMSLDGYVEGPGGDVLALPMDGFFDAHNLDRQRAADTLLLGATTYRVLKAELRRRGDPRARTLRPTRPSPSCTGRSATQQRAAQGRRLGLPERDRHRALDGDDDDRPPDRRPRGGRGRSSSAPARTS